MAKLNVKASRKRLHQRIRQKIRGTTERPRLCVHFSSRHIYAQIIDDQKGLTILSVNTTEKELAKKKVVPTVAGAQSVGQLIAERAQEKKMSQVVFDRGGFTYHGKVKALADAARAGGLNF